MAKIANPHKKFQFGLLFFGMPEMLAQKVTTPEFSLDQIEHGEGNHKIKTAGQISFSNVTIERLENASLTYPGFWSWIQTIQNAPLNIGLPPIAYKRDCQILRYNHAGAKIGAWLCTGVWPQKINGVELDRMSSDNTIESIELSIDFCTYV